MSVSFRGDPRCDVELLLLMSREFVVFGVILVCAFHGVSPRDRWLCVLPGWRMNVNVNVNV